MSADYPHVRLSPGHRFGRLQIDNIEVETIAASVWVEGVAFTCEGYELTRPPGGPPQGVPHIRVKSDA